MALDTSVFSAIKWVWNQLQSTGFLSRPKAIHVFILQSWCNQSELMHKGPQNILLLLHLHRAGREMQIRCLRLDWSEWEFEYLLHFHEATIKVKNRLKKRFSRFYNSKREEISRWSYEMFEINIGTAWWKTKNRTDWWFLCLTLVGR